MYTILNRAFCRGNLIANIPDHVEITVWMRVQCMGMDSGICASDHGGFGFLPLNEVAKIGLIMVADKVLVGIDHVVYGCADLDLFTACR